MDRRSPSSRARRRRALQTLLLDLLLAVGLSACGGDGSSTPTAHDTGQPAAPGPVGPQLPPPSPSASAPTAAAPATANARSLPS